MRIKAAMVGAIAVAFVGGWLVAGNSVSVQGQAQPNAGLPPFPARKAASTSPARMRWSPTGPSRSPTCPATRTGRGAQCRASSRRAPTVSTWSSEASCRPCSGPRPVRFPTSDRACRFLSVRRRSATRLRVRRRARRAGGPGQDPDDPKQAWQGRMGVDARWEHTIVVFNAAGDLVEGWTQGQDDEASALGIRQPVRWTEDVWIVDDHSHAIFKFTNDGKQLLQTIGTGQSRIGRRAFQPPHVHVVAARWQLLRGRRI